MKPEYIYWIGLVISLIFVSAHIPWEEEPGHSTNIESDDGSWKVGVLAIGAFLWPAVVPALLGYHIRQFFRRRE